MQYCPKCKINVRGNKECCPLCQGMLRGEPEAPAFPVAGDTGERTLSLFRIMTFVMIVIEVMGAAFRFLSGWGLRWIGIVMIYTLVAWADLWIALYFRNNMIKLVTCELYIAMIICCITDRASGWRGWSVEWVVPMTFVGMFVATLLIGVVLHLTLETYVVYLLMDTLFSLLQMIPIAAGFNSFPYPAVLSMAGLLILVAGVALFRTDDLKSASGKWFHI